MPIDQPINEDGQSVGLFFDALIDQIDWLREAGFSVVDCPWRYLLWSVIQARKTP